MVEVPDSILTGVELFKLTGVETLEMVDALLMTDV